MAMYEPIKVYSDDEKRGMADRIMGKNINIGGGDGVGAGGDGGDGHMDADVEMAVRPISKSPTGVGGAACKNISNGEAAVASLPSKSRQQQQRLVSLDVFRGLTVAVTSAFPGFS
ncbi:hypothetical protein TB2_021197 [Malus domestica]